MESQVPAAELPGALEVSGLTIPPNIDYYAALRASPSNTDSGQQVTNVIPPFTAPRGSAGQALPVHSRVQSVSDIHFEQGVGTEQHAAQLVQLLQQDASSADAFTQAPFVEYLKQQAEELPADADTQAAIVWQLTDHAAVAQAMQQCIQQPSFGQETDAICAWFYEWYRSDAPLLRRFVARFAPDLARRYLFHCLSTSERDPVPGLEACLVAIFEVKSSSADFFRLPDLSQPSVHHGLPSFPAGKAGGNNGLLRQQSSLTVTSPTYSILPAGVAALFGSSAKLGTPKVLSGVRSWQRNAVAGAALQCFCSWMVTFSDATISQFASLALSLAAAGCLWLQAEAQHVLQEQLQLGPGAQTVHTPQPSSTYRVHLSPDVLDPLCHGLGHAIFRLALAMQQTQPAMLSSSQMAAYRPVSATLQPSSSSSSLEAVLSVVTEAVAGLHIRTTYDLSPDGVLLTQSLLAQLHQLYHPVQAPSSATMHM